MWTDLIVLPLSGAAVVRTANGDALATDARMRQERFRCWRRNFNADWPCIYALDAAMHQIIPWMGGRNLPVFFSPFPMPFRTRNVKARPTAPVLPERHALRGGVPSKRPREGLEQTINLTVTYYSRSFANGAFNARNVFWAAVHDAL